MRYRFNVAAITVQTCIRCKWDISIKHLIKTSNPDRGRVKRNSCWFLGCQKGQDSLTCYRIVRKRHNNHTLLSKQKWCTNEYHIIVKHQQFSKTTWSESKTLSKLVHDLKSTTHLAHSNSQDTTKTQQTEIQPTGNLFFLTSWIQQWRR